MTVLIRAPEPGVYGENTRLPGGILLLAGVCILSSPPPKVKNKIAERHCNSFALLGMATQNKEDDL